MNDSKASALFVAGVAAVLASVYWLARLGLRGDSPLFIGVILAVAWFLLLLPPFLVSRRSGSRVEDRRPWYRTQPAYALLTLAILQLGGLLTRQTGLPVVEVIAVCGLVLMGWVLVQAASAVRAHPIISVAAVLGTAIFAILIAGQVWAQGYLSPLFLEKLALGTAHIDTLFHASISSMILTYGIPSTGLDGLPFIHYHFGSHALIAWLSALVRMSPLDFYQLAYPTVLVPFFLQSLLGFAACTSVRIFGRPIRLCSRRGVVVWLVLALSFASVLPHGVSSRVGVYGIVTSESYLIGMSLFFLTATVLMERFAGRSEVHLDTADKLLLVLVMPVLLVSIGLAKVSILALSAALLLYLFVRLGLYRSSFLWAAAGVCAFATAAALMITSPSSASGGSGLSFLPFIRDYVVRDATGARAVVLALSFLGVHFFWSWLYMALRLHQLDVTSTKRLGEVWQEKLAPDVEAVAIIVVLGALPGFLLAIDGGSAGYFSGVQQWLSVGLLMGMIQSVAPLPARPEHGTFAAGLQTRGTWAVVTTTLLCLVVLASALSWGLELVRSQASTRSAVLAAVGDSPPQIIEPALSGLFSGDILHIRRVIGQRLEAYRSALDRNPRYQLLTMLRNVGRIPPGGRQDTAVYIPRGNTTYWDMLPEYGVAFVAPTMAQVAAVDGLPEQPPERLNYGLSSYDWRPRPLSLDEASKRAIRLGFDRLIVFDGRQPEGRTIWLDEDY